jgi:hypothetical protein
MRHLFYLLGIVAVLWEFTVLTQTNRILKFKKQFKKDVKNSFDEWNSTQKTYSFFALGYIIWTFAGLLSSQWLVFLFLILISVIIPKNKVLLLKFDSIISIICLLFIILNKYHLHINLYEYLMLLINS